MSKKVSTAHDTQEVALNIKDKLLEDLKGEYDAISLYQKHINAFPDGKVKEKLKEIRDEEVHHTKELQELLEKEASIFKGMFNSYKSVYNIE